jgi:hypothetical protein
MEKDIKGLAEKKLAEKLTKIYKWGAGSERAGYYDPEEAQEAILSDAQEIITTLEKEFGYILLKSSEMKIIGGNPYDKSEESYKFMYVENQIWKPESVKLLAVTAYNDGKTDQLLADQKAHAGMTKELIDAYEGMLDGMGLGQDNFKASDWQNVQDLKARYGG